MKKTVLRAYARLIVRTGVNIQKDQRKILFLLKLDILGHDAPSMIRQLQDMTGVDPLTVPIKDDKVMTIFVGTEGLDIKDPDYKFTHGSYGIPEFGTKFVRQMLDDIQPTSFEELVRISGLSHGTDVWLGNAQGLP